VKCKVISTSQPKLISVAKYGPNTHDLFKHAVTYTISAQLK